MEIEILKKFYFTRKSMLINSNLFPLEFYFEKSIENLSFWKAGYLTVFEALLHGPADNQIYHGHWLHVYAVFVHRYTGIRLAEIFCTCPCAIMPQLNYRVIQAGYPAARNIWFTLNYLCVIVTTRLTVPSRIYRRYPFRDRFLPVSRSIPFVVARFRVKIDSRKQCCKYK